MRVPGANRSGLGRDPARGRVVRATAYAFGQRRDTHGAESGGERAPRVRVRGCPASPPSCGWRRDDEEGRGTVAPHDGVTTVQRRGL
jgi:hypothetical protein